MPDVLLLHGEASSLNVSSLCTKHSQLVFLELNNLSKNITLFRVFFSISAVALGGGLTMLPIMSREFVEKRGWLSDNDMLDTVAVMQSLPGIISINMAVLIGYRVSGVLGAVFSALGVILPPFVAIILLAMFLTKLDNNETVNHVFLGVRAAVAAMILLSAVKLAKQALKSHWAQAIAVFGFIAMVFFEMNAILLVIIGALVGLSVAYLPILFKSKKKEEQPAK